MSKDLPELSNSLCKYSHLKDYDEIKTYVTVVFRDDKNVYLYKNDSMYKTSCVEVGEGAIYSTVAQSLIDQSKFKIKSVYRIDGLSFLVNIVPNKSYFNAFNFLFSFDRVENWEPILITSLRDLPNIQNKDVIISLLSIEI
uniref:Uncharacterized protein n=1 Tax=viral metagenome TaxID=1070528 RepID=A0A6C0BDT5_9ZZZZ